MFYYYILRILRLLYCHQSAYCSFQHGRSQCEPALIIIPVIKHIKQFITGYYALGGCWPAFHVKAGRWERPDCDSTHYLSAIIHCANVDRTAGITRIQVHDCLLWKYNYKIDDLANIAPRPTPTPKDLITVGRTGEFLAVRLT